MSCQCLPEPKRRIHTALYGTLRQLRRQPWTGTEMYRLGTLLGKFAGERLKCMLFFALWLLSHTLWPP